MSKIGGQVGAKRFSSKKKLIESTNPKLQQLNKEMSIQLEDYYCSQNYFDG